MEKIKKDALQAAKEITCKFIETRTVSPANFPEVFPGIYKVVFQTLLQCECIKDAGGNDSDEG